MGIVIVIAPHPDDETLGCGGTLLRHVAKGDDVYWLIMTSITGVAGYTEEQVAARDKEIDDVSLKYKFKDVFRSSFATTELDTLPKREIIGFIAKIFNTIQPDTVYIPYKNDVHSDHEVVFSSAISCTKSFRYPCVRRVRVYETLSETEFDLNVDGSSFMPNLWVDVSGFLAEKIEIMKLYDGEMKEHPFPRSIENIKALATLRGSTAGCIAAEAFISIKEVI